MKWVRLILETKLKEQRNFILCIIRFLVIILVSTSLYKSAFSTYSFGKTSFHLPVCYIWRKSQDKISWIVNCKVESLKLNWYKVRLCLINHGDLCTKPIFGTWHCGLVFRVSVSLVFRFLFFCSMLWSQCNLKSIIREYNQSCVHWFFSHFIQTVC